MRLAVPAIGLSLAAAWATLGERQRYRVVDVDVSGVASLPRALRVLHLTDTHLSPPAEKMVAFLHSLAHVDADLIALTGDMLGDDDAVDVLLSALDPLLSRSIPAVAVLGLNDMVGPIWRNPLSYLRGPSEGHDGVALATDDFVAGLEDRGVEVLRGRTAQIMTALGPVAVGGFDDPHPMTDDSDLPPAQDLRAPDDAIVRIGLVHAPYRRALDFMVECGWDLTLCGHTHGGQVCLPGGRALVTNCDLPPRNASGVHRHGPMAVHVSQGLGTSKYQPFRFSCPPQAELLHVR